MTMKKFRLASIISRFFFILGFGAVIFILAGFFKFAEATINTGNNLQNIRAQDGIVALTGGSAERLKAGVSLLERHKGKKLLISGVFKSATKEEIRAIAGGSRELFACCVNLGKDATDTIGNAQEVKKWAHDNHFESLIIVTDNYHIPRSMLEISHAAPELELVPFATRVSPFIDKYWWQDEKAVKGLATEYSKYLLAGLRLKLGIEPQRKDLGNKND
ncbi:MAG: hypothetical protein FD163_302 [Hyphomonadaceae bacterium]|nr:MAG: hypothetical protein FD128_151 [Hyphomonadaceae bacterium]KAF0187027.1 MAG: hypothetical protein FD163_302 [Hyphomonadaceae bacterium]